MTPDDPRHGQRAGYDAGCKEQCCRDATARYSKRLLLDHSAGKVRRVSSVGTIRRIQALSALGFTYAEIGRAAGGIRDSVIGELIANQRPIVRRSTAVKIAHAYRTLDRAPTEPAFLRSRLRNAAQRKGWPPPLAWDNIDDPDEQPQGIRDGNHPIDPDDYDQAVVDRILGGEKLPATPAERRAVVAQWKGTINDLEALTGWRAHRYQTKQGAA